jgi:hypothetical protein
MRRIDLLILVLATLIISSCASTKPPVIYLPTQNSEVMSFYRNGLPIGVVNTDSSFIIVLLEPTDVGDTDYMRLWLLYKNNSNTPYLLEPLKAVKLSILSIKGDRKSFDNITPESPTKILAHIKNEKTVSLIAQAIGGTLKAMSTQQTTITNRKGDEWVVNDKDSKVDAVLARTRTLMINTAVLYDIFENSVNSGILRRNTIFPGESVNGYIYFPLPLDKESVGPFSIKPESYNYRLFITTQIGGNVIEFTPAEGE